VLGQGAFVTVVLPQRNPAFWDLQQSAASSMFPQHILFSHDVTGE